MNGHDKTANNVHLRRITPTQVRRLKPFNTKPYSINADNATGDTLFLFLKKGCIPPKYKTLILYVLIYIGYSRRNTVGVMRRYSALIKSIFLNKLIISKNCQLFLLGSEFSMPGEKEQQQ